MSYIILKDGTKKEFDNMEMMGIINVTPDSFYKGSRVDGVEEALARAEKMISEGATFLDVGGESTRPGATPVPADVEMERVCPVISAIKERWPDILLSVDTYNSETAKAAIYAGADIINDISAMTFDESMAEVIYKEEVPVILMHTGGRPEVMMEEIPAYKDVVGDVYNFLKERINYAVSKGIRRDRIITDVGIGFGKTYEQNVELIRNIYKFTDLGCPKLLAVSRKSFLSTITGREDPEDRLYGTLAVTGYAERYGVEIARVHDVGANMDILKVLRALGESGHYAITKPEEKVLYKAVISLGSNMGDREHFLEMALFDIERKVGKILAKSDIIETEPYGMVNQDMFLNMAITVETYLGPDELLEMLLEIEASLGRTRILHWGPRTIDLDIIYIDDRIINTNKLQVPHKERLKRDFVLGPIAQIAPDLIDPVEGKPVGVLYQELERSKKR